MPKLRKLKVLMLKKQNKMLKDLMSRHLIPFLQGFHQKWRFYSFTHSQESNTFSVDGVARQTWCILSKNDNLQNFSLFSELYDGDIFEISEAKTEPLHLPIPWGPASKSEKSMFFGPASLNIIQNFIFSQALDWTRWPVGRFRHT